MKFTLNRDKVVSAGGHAIEFKKGVPTHVPPAAYKAVTAVGGIPDEQLEDDPEPQSKEPADADQREKLILSTMKQMADKNAREDFTGTGMPTLPALNERLGFRIDAAERDALWTQYVQSQG